MALIHQVKLGEVGTPEQHAALAALVQLADVASGATTALELVAVPETAMMLYAEANFHPALGCVKTCRFELRDAAGNVQKWFNGQGTITPTENCTDAQIGIPVVTGGNTVDFVDGVAEVEFKLVTDEGATKTYATGDYVTLTMAMANILGVAVDVSAAAHKLECEATPLLVSYIAGVADKTLTPSAAQANRAGALSMREYVELRLEDSEGHVQTWFDGNVAMTATENCADAQIGVPKVYTLAGVEVAAGGNLAMADGVARYYFVYATDYDATKHYIATDFVTITPVMAAIGGEAVTETDAIVVATFAA